MYEDLAALRSRGKERQQGRAEGVEGVFCGMARKGWQVGDKVSFINGWGAVSWLNCFRVSVLVLTDDGFEVPCPEKRAW